MFGKIKVSITRFLNRIAKQNEETYGNKKMDCCELNKLKKDKKK